MNFQEAYVGFMEKQMKNAEGERLKRLKEHGYLEKLLLEKVWWPAVGNFDHLYAEYEVIDYKDGDRFLDYAFVQPFCRINLEGDGFHPHAKSASKWQFSDDRNRQNDLVIDGWHVLRFAHDDIVHNPRKCQMKLQQLMGKLMLARRHSDTQDNYTFLERAAVRYAAYSGGIVTPIELERYLGVGQRKVNGILKVLIESGKLIAVGDGERIRRYKLTVKDVSPFLQI